MTRFSLLRSILIILLLLISSLLSAETLRVNEDKSRLEMFDGAAELRLEVLNQSSETLKTHVELTFLVPSGAIAKSVEHDESLKPGRNQLRFRVPQLTAGLKANAVDELPWFRLRYRLSLASGEATHGIASLSRLMPETFRLQLGLLRNPVRDKPWVIHVLAQGPVDMRPIEGVKLNMELTISPEGGKYRVEHFSGRTDALGVGTFSVMIPGNLGSSEIAVSVEGKRGNEVRIVEDSISVRSGTQILVTTDKPIYQPGQSLKVRALAYADSGIALRSHRLQFKVEDSEGVTAYQTEVTTSRFGEAHTEWTIPEYTRLGQFSIEVQDGGDAEDSARASVEVRRYDLPNFSVSVKPDRTFYLPGQNANLEIQTDYLFGQHVGKAKIRVVRDDDDEDNPEAESIVEGEADIQGRFRASIDLQEPLGKLDKDSNRFDDAVFTAYATDSTTGRTESRKFALRLSTKAIHIYAVATHALATGHPYGILVATQYPDGRPAECEVQVSEVSMGGVAENNTTQTVRTNRYGIAYLQNDTWKAVSNAELDGNWLTLTLTARDAAGNAGENGEQFRVGHAATWVTTDRIAYFSGDPIQVHVQSTHASGLVVLDLVRDGLLLNSRVIELQDAAADVTVQSNDSYQGTVAVTAHFAGATEADSEGDTHTVYFPTGRRLQLELLPGKNSYAPGSDATLSFRVQSPQKYSSEALLGISIVDRGVDERKRTDFPDSPIQESDADFGSLTSSELLKIDRNIALPEDLRLAAEYLLNPYHTPYGYRHFSNSDDSPPKYVFQNSIDQSMRTMKAALDAHFEKDRTYATDEISLKAILFAAGLNPNDFRDPWDSAYQFSFEFQRANAYLNVRSAGPDKTPGTGDDFEAFRWEWPYFQKRSEILGQAVLKYQSATGEFVRDLQSLRKALLRSGEDLDQWLDPWGRAYQYGFDVRGTNRSISVISAGADGIFTSKEKPSLDDAPVLTTYFDYVGRPRRLVQEALNQFYSDQGSYPQTESQLQHAMNAGGVSDSELIDPWGHRFYPVIGKVFEYRDSYVRNFIGDSLTYAEFLELERNTLRVIPVTQQIQMITYRSAGPDGVEGNLDDFDAFRLSRLVAQQSANEATPHDTVDSPLLNQKEGAIHGLVQDSTGALIPGVTVRLFQDGVEMQKAVTTDDGQYTFARLVPGYYEVRFKLTGFRLQTIRDVPVQNRATELNIILAIGTSDTVNVAFSSASVGEVLSKSSLFDLQQSPGPDSSLKPREVTSPFTSMPAQTLTPRLRQYFPETLVWQPSLEVDRKGYAQLHFKLADNITRWKIRATASTIDGRFAAASADIVSWQPFFVEHDPPKFLTVGDEISLPVVMRSYLDRDQSLNISMKLEPWFEIAGTPQRSSHIDSGATARETFRVTALTSIKGGKQRVTASGSEASDAIERTVTVRPDGREVVQTQSRVLQGSTVLDVTIPANRLQHTIRAELKIFPDVMSQITAAMEGIMQRPYGCAEQQISSAYPGLLLLQHQKKFGGVSSSVTALAKKNLIEAYVNLLGLQAGGGFSYWSNGTADIAVSAYAVEFLQSAGQIISVDEGVMNRAAAWIALQQRPDGSWSRTDVSPVNSRADVLTLTGYVARVLSDPEIRKLMGRSTGTAQTPARDTLHDALGFLRANAAQWGEPASLASVALTALNIGDRETAIRALTLIERSAHAERGATYWDLQTNTLFYGWGLPGRLESTALSVRALDAGREAGILTENTSALIERGRLFMLGNKDRYGVWYSTQATIRVLETLERLAGKPSVRSASSSRIELWIDSVKVATPIDASDLKSGAPFSLDISKYLKADTNRIELRGGGAGGAIVQIVESHYVPWGGDSVSVEPALRLNVAFDRTSGKADDEITATVNAARVGFRGYGMMLAEIGLPPGVDVDRASLDKAIGDSGAALFRYDVLPDRIVAYLWPKAGGSQFQFKFRPRFGMDAQAPPSVMYDYYNPEAQTVLRPVRFHLD
jgi:hypothetical protein